MEWPGKCEKCDGSGKIKTKGTPGLRPYYQSSWVEVEVDCDLCNGTGERELTVDEAANVIWDCGWRITQVFKTVNGRRWVAVEEIYGYGVHFSEDGDTLKEAFNAAARAAYRRQG